VDDRLRYADVRPYAVPDSLGELVGPASGVVELPVHLAWSGLRVYDLGDERQLRLLYKTAIRESMDVAEVDRYPECSGAGSGVAAAVATTRRFGFAWRAGMRCRHMVSSCCWPVGAEQVIQRHAIWPYSWISPLRRSRRVGVA
jgi:hypothetical protein